MQLSSEIKIHLIILFLHSGTDLPACPCGMDHIEITSQSHVSARLYRLAVFGPWSAANARDPDALLVDVEQAGRPPFPQPDNMPQGTGAMQARYWFLLDLDQIRIIQKPSNFLDVKAIKERYLTKQGRWNFAA